MTCDLQEFAVETRRGLAYPGAPQDELGGPTIRGDPSDTRTQRVFSHGGTRMLNVEVVDQWPTLDRTHPDMRLIEDYVAWRKTPPFLARGRSAWCRSTSELRLESGHVVRSFKIKGVGVLDAE